MGALPLARSLTRIKTCREESRHGTHECVRYGYSAVNSRLGHSHIHVNPLHGGDTRAEPDRMAVRFQDDLQLGDHREQVGEIEIAEMRDAKNLALHRALSVGDDGAEAVAEFLDDDAGIH